MSYSRSQTRPVLLEFQLDLPSQVGDIPASSKPVKEEHHGANTYRSGRLMCSPDTQSMFAPHQETFDPGSNEDLYSPPRLLYPIPEDPEEHSNYDTTWAPATLRPPTEFPAIVVRSPQHVFQPLAQRVPVPLPVPDQRSPMPASWPTSLACHAEYASDGSGSFTGSSESSVNPTNGYGYGSWDGPGYSVHHIQPSSQQNTNGCPPSSAGQDYYGAPCPHRQSQSESQPPSFFQPQSQHYSFSQSEFDHSSRVHSQPGSHMNPYGQDVPAQPPVVGLHQRSSATLPEHFAYDRGDNKAVSPLPRHLSKSRFISDSPSPVPTQPSSAASSRSFSLSLSPTPSVASDHSSWGALSSRHQRRLDLAPYIPVAARKLYGKGKEHTNTVTEPWCPESLRGMRNAKQLSHRPPFAMPEGAVPLHLPLPPVRPHGRVGDENYEERNSFIYAEDTNDLNPYHPSSWDRCPRLPGPLPSRSDKEQHNRDRATAALAGFRDASTRFGE
ncbi:hypothetical protein FRC06_009688 [Ceratobasidium sp. 370]|nr:hypothetical protein FRC06_009688 [Ceratobasidium sp. 370]